MFCTVNCWKVLIYEKCVGKANVNEVENYFQQIEKKKTITEG